MFRKSLYSNKVDYSLSYKLLSAIKNIKNIKNSTIINSINKEENKENDQKITFNILIATIGRNTLENLIESLIDQLNKDDCITIIFDNNKIRPISNIEKLKCKIVIINEKSKLGYWGHGIRNKYASILERKTFILHADDDDTYFPNSFDKLREVCIDQNILYIASIMNQKKLIPKSNNKKIMLGNIGTPCGIIPYGYNNRSIWGNFYGGDAKFYLDLIKQVKYKFINVCIYNCENIKDNLEAFLLLKNSKIII